MFLSVNKSLENSLVTCSFTSIINEKNHGFRRELHFLKKITVPLEDRRYRRGLGLRGPPFLKRTTVPEENNGYRSKIRFLKKTTVPEENHGS